MVSRNIGVREQKMCYVLSKVPQLQAFSILRKLRASRVIQPCWRSCGWSVRGCWGTTSCESNCLLTRLLTRCMSVLDKNLVGGLEHFLIFHLLRTIIPTDFHIFRGETTKQRTLFKVYRTTGHGRINCNSVEIITSMCN